MKVTHRLTLSNKDMELYLPQVLLALHGLCQSMTPVVAPSTITVDDEDRILNPLHLNMLLEGRKEINITNEDQKLLYVLLDLGDIEFRFHRLTGFLKLTYSSTLESKIRKFFPKFHTLFSDVQRDLGRGKVMGQYNIISEEI